MWPSFKRTPNERGATLVEFAIIVPLLLLLLFGIIEFGRIITEFTTIRTAAREGARFATTVETTGGVPNYRNCSGIIAAANSKLVIGTIESISVEWTDLAPGHTHAPCTDTVSNNPGPNAVVSGTKVQVTVTSSFDSVVPIMEIFLDGIALDTEQTREIFFGEATT